MDSKEVNEIMLRKYEEAPYIKYEATKQVISNGGQILLPFKVGDAQITFRSRWALAKIIDDLIEDALLDH